MMSQKRVRQKANRERAKSFCCGTSQISFGPVVTLLRGPPKRRRLKASRRVFHRLGDEHWWHWEDQKVAGRAPGYGTWGDV